MGIDSMRRARAAGFTLVELLLAIIGVLIALLMPAIQSSREAARRTACANNTKQIGLAIANYQWANGAFPSSSTDEPGDLSYDPWSSMHHHSWASVILPYAEEKSLHKMIDFSASIFNNSNQPAAATIVRMYRCPAYAGPDFTADTHYAPSPGNKFAIGNYVAMGASDVDHLWGVQGKPEGVIFPLSRIKPRDVTDGLSNTMFIAESREERLRVWIDGRTAANTALCDVYSGDPAVNSRISLSATPYFRDGDVVCQYGPSSMHQGGALHLFGDGSVHFIRDSTSAKIYLALCTRAGGETIDHVD
jgi:Tfp pilus assembly protein PilE